MNMKRLLECGRVRQRSRTIGEEFYFCPSYWATTFNGDPYRTGPFSDPNAAVSLPEYVEEMIFDVYREYRQKRVIPLAPHLSYWPFLPMRKITKRADLLYRSAPHRFRPEDSCSAHNNGLYSKAEWGWATRNPHDEWVEKPYNCVDDGKALVTWHAPVYQAAEFTESTEDWLRSLESYLPALRARMLKKLDAKRTTMPDLLAMLGESKDIGGFASLPRSVGDAWLYYNFGVKPTYGDVSQVKKGLAKDLEKARALLKRLKNSLHGGQIIVPVVAHMNVKVGAGSVLAEFHTKADWCVAGSSVKCPKDGYYRVTETRSDYLGVMSLWVIENRAVTGILGTLDIYLQQLNALGDLSTVWEIIPFSWMVDYFVGVQNLLRELSALAKLGKWSNATIVDGAYSFRRCRSIEHVEHTIPCTRSEMTYVTSVQEYVRIPWDDPYSEIGSGIETSLPKGWSQLLNMAAVGRLV